MKKQLISQALESHLSELVSMSERCDSRFMISQSLEWKRFSPAGF